MKKLVFSLVILGAGVAHAAGTGDADAAKASTAAFKPLYDFINSSATGYLGKTIGVMSILYGVGSGVLGGRIGTAVSGFGLGVAGLFGPTMINSLYSSALI